MRFQLVISSSKWGCSLVLGMQHAHPPPLWRAPGTIFAIVSYLDALERYLGSSWRSAASCRQVAPSAKMGQHGHQERDQDQRKHFDVLRRRNSHWLSPVLKNGIQDPNRIIKMLLRSRQVVHLRVLAGHRSSPK